MEETVKNATPHKRATKVGKVVSDAMDKSVVVEVGRRVEHGRYKRTIRRTSRFMAHDESNTAKVGDRVRLGNVDLSALSRRQLRPHRKHIQMVFQDPFGSLNPRLTVVQLIAQGRSNKEIGGELGISERTVKTHVSNIFGKLELTDRTQVALYAHKRGLTDPEP